MKETGEKQQNKHEIIYQSEFLPLQVESDIVVLELTNYKEYFLQNLRKGKYFGLDKKKINKFKIFICHLLRKTEKIVILLPSHCDVTDFVEIFDDILFEEELQWFYIFFFFLIKKLNEFFLLASLNLIV